MLHCTKNTCKKPRVNYNSDYCAVQQIGGNARGSQVQFGTWIFNLKFDQPKSEQENGIDP